MPEAVSSVIDRANDSRWHDEGAKTLEERAHAEVNNLLQQYEPSQLSDDIKDELVKHMETEANRYGQDHLPDRA